MKRAGKLLALSLAVTCVSALATEKPPDGAKAAPAAQGMSTARSDNTAINARDQGGATMTPQDQTNTLQDREQLAAVRRAIVADKSLSTMAHNVKVLVAGGGVTLRGPVKNADEKAKVESLAKSVKGITTTDNQLDVRTSAASQ